VATIFFHSEISSILSKRFLQYALTIKQNWILQCTSAKRYLHF